MGGIATQAGREAKSIAQNGREGQWEALGGGRLGAAVAGFQNVA